MNKYGTPQQRMHNRCIQLWNRFNAYELDHKDRIHIRGIGINITKEVCIEDSGHGYSSEITIDKIYSMDEKGYFCYNSNKTKKIEVLDAVNHDKETIESILRSFLDTEVEERGTWKYLSTEDTNSSFTTDIYLYETSISKAAGTELLVNQINWK